MQSHKILIVGAGAVGGYLGASLCRAGQEVTFLVRPKTAAAISKNGLQIKSTKDSFIVHPPAISQASQMAFADSIILAVKCTDLLDVLEEIAPLVRAGATLLTLQNGVDSEERIRAYFNNADCVVAGVTYITARKAAPGIIDHYRRGTISIGEQTGQETDRVRKLHEALSKGIHCHLTGSILKEKWEKLCWNALFNPLSMILDAPLSLILKSEPLLEIVRAGIREVIAVAQAERFSLDPNLIEDTLTATQALADFHTSMYEDYKNEKPTEIEHLNGDICRRAAKHSIPTPINQTLYALVKGLELKQVQKPTG